MFRNKTVNRLLAIIVALIYVLIALSVFSFKVYATDVEAERAAKLAEEKMDNLTTSEAVDLVAINEEADSAGITMARQVVNDYEREKEDERIEEENRRLEEWRKKREAEIKKAQEEQRFNKFARIARENTDKTGRNNSWNGRRLSSGAGTIMGPSGKETYYNLNMSVCVNVMRRMGYSEEEYPYEVRSDGVKTLGGLVMVAANLKLRPRGSLIETSVGPGIVVDTGGFASRNARQLDICVAW
ncbi:MAG: hypothetical protein IJH41_01735 [Eubacterium sp.]|nr:hypothetical protein [Eubacterium sp.]